MQVALVTGAGSGLGRAVARRLLKNGFLVAAHYCSNFTGVDELVREFSAERCLPIQADFLVPDSPHVILDRALAWHGRLDALVNNAALIERVAIEEIDQALLARTLQANATSPLLLTRGVLECMSAQGSGRIVSVSSIGVKFFGSPHTVHYMVSKAALEAGTLALAKLAAPVGVLVNVVRPGIMRTAGLESLGRDLTSRERLIPLGRAADPREVAEFIGFLVSPANTYITGSVLPVAGGE